MAEAFGGKGEKAYSRQPLLRYDYIFLCPSFFRVKLTSIKLSGFKSFVDPTTIRFQGKLNGIVGPNGCGKSNIMDAVRWVLGESRASELRGESMKDVIFNGTTTRKPARW